VRGDLTREEGWQRLHPLSPLARGGRLVPIVLFSLVLSATRGGGSAEFIYLAVAVVSMLAGVIQWWVTRWRIEGDALRIETGLIRRDSRRLPLARIQAVDIVRPLMARLLGISELRIRLAASGSTDGRLAFLSESAALELREFLLAGHRRVAAAPSGEPGAPEATEIPLAQVGTGRLAGSVLLSGASATLITVVLVLIVLAAVAPGTAAAAVGFSAVYLFGFATGLWRRLSVDFHFEAVEADGGVRIRRGLLQTVSETVPFERIQAVRQVEPLLWRLMGWCRLEVDIAGAGRKSQRGEGSGVARKALLPVGTRQEAWLLVDRMMGGPSPAMSRPPRRARTKAPLSYHFLSAGHDRAHAVCSTGRLCRVTAWVPLEKSQSIRRVQGPVQRRLGLATVHVDAAGRTRAEFRDRSTEEADHLVEELTDLSRQARLDQTSGRVPSAAAEPAGTADPPPGWYTDPSGRYAQRYWNGAEWTAQVGDGTTTAVDPP
jgi:putative membrane protein